MLFSSSILNPQITSISLGDLASDKFKKSDLITSRVNLSAEEKKGYLDAEEIKKIISGDLINVRGLYKNTITFRPKTKIIAASNGAPTFTDKSDGMMRRFVIIKFENQYKDPSEIEKIKYAKEKNIYPWDLDLRDKIKKEKSAIFNLFLDGLMKLKKRKYQFILGAKFDEAINEFKKDSDTAREFLEDNYEIDLEGEMSLQDVYNHYREWYQVNVQDNRAMKFRANEMGRRIREIFGMKAKGQSKMFNPYSQQYEKLTVYGLKRIIIEGDMDDKIISEFGGNIQNNLDI